MDKKLLRKTLITRRDALNPTTLLENSNAIVATLLSLPIVKQSNTVFVYQSFRGEVRTDGLICALEQMGKTVVFPLTQNDKMYAVKPLSVNYEMDRFGIKIPTEYEVVDDIDLAITPLVACDEARNRMGFGKGFYDRFFATHPCYKIGLCHDFQVVKALEPSPWDIALDCIITEKRIF